MRGKLIVGNWKMHLTPAESRALIEPILTQVGKLPDKDVVVCPPFVNLHVVCEVVRNSNVKLGAQGVFWEDSGAFTGQISPSMLQSLGCQYCIVGHSEQRGRFGSTVVPEGLLGYFSETDETINRKVQALTFRSITPIVCVGETRAERDAGQTEDVIRGQLDGAFAGLEAAEVYGACIAYEPVWAIGTGDTCDPDEADRVCGLIRGWLTEKCGADLADYVRVLYGGSVRAANSDALFAKECIDGGLVGGASLKADEFARIVISA